MATNGLGFLDESQAIKIPVGGDWAPSGMIGQWRAKVCFAFNSPTDIGMVETTLKPLALRKRRNDFRYFFGSSKEAIDVQAAMGEKAIIEQVWYWDGPRDKVANVDAENLIKWPEWISMEVKITTLGSRKHRHELHMIALPAAVASAAKALGYDVPEMNFRDLAGTQVIFDDALALRLVGLGDDKEAYLKSDLWLQRSAIWAALGEPDAAKYQPKGTGTKFDTEADKLSACLHILTQPWKSAIYARLVQVPDPRVDAVYGDESKRLTIPALTEIFPNEAAAKQAGADELKARAERNAASATVSTGQDAAGSAPIPMIYADSPEVWKGFIDELKARPQIKGKPALVVKAYLEKSIDLTTAGVTLQEILTAVMAK